MQACEVETIHPGSVLVAAGDVQLIWSALQIMQRRHEMIKH